MSPRICPGCRTLDGEHDFGPGCTLAEEANEIDAEFHRIYIARGYPLPSQVIVDGAILPLVGTLGRAEREYAAAHIVRVCQVLGDRWQTVTPRKVGVVLKKDLAENVEPWRMLSANPFFRPDFRDLCAAGYASMGKGTKEEGGDPVRLLPKFFESAERWFRR